MKLIRVSGLATATLCTLISWNAQAFFFIIPIPNIAKPPVLQKTIDALEKSEETKALAYVSEDKTFGSKYWVWGHYVGKVTQEDANRQALAKCQGALANAKAQQVGGSTLYDFGNKACELYEFENKTIAATLPVPQTAPAEAGKPLSADPKPKSSALPPPNSDSTSDSNAAERAPAADSPTAIKLRELSKLLKEGLITQQEHDEKRKKLLDAL